jgi:hypothetical protein
VSRHEQLLAARRKNLRAELEAIESVLFSSTRPSSPPVAVNNVSTLSAVGKKGDG